ncbi:MAG: nitrogenase iron protein [Candidatus Schekmanbacteria bacterium]|nr:MAG: nitrogenase iron protein [Candidatus Schekmanbacteria bacterium]
MKMEEENSTIRQIAIYGKGGIGKSTVCCNLSLCFMEFGERVFQLGCSPKNDSTYLLRTKVDEKPTILESIRNFGRSEEALMESIYSLDDNLYCAETGGPEPARGCAGKGIAVALDLLKHFKIPERIGATAVIYDVVGDVVCGGFAQPMRSGFAQEIYLVTSGELMSLYSANNISLAVNDLAKKGSKVRIAGIIGNLRGVENEEIVIKEFGKLTGIPIISTIPRDEIIQVCEGKGEAVMKGAPENPIAEIYKKTAENIYQNRQRVVPQPLSLEKLIEMLRRYQSDTIQLKMPA